MTNAQQIIVAYSGDSLISNQKILHGSSIFKSKDQCFRSFLYVISLLKCRYITHDQANRSYLRFADHQSS